MLNQKSQALVVDCDTHFWQPLQLWESYIDEEYRDAIRQVIDTSELVPAAARVRVEEAMKIKGGDYPEERIEWMDEEGIDVCIIYPTTMAFLCYHEDIDIAAAACRGLNRWAAEFAKAAPDRLLPCMVLPWYDPARALEEFHIAHELGLKVAFSTPTPSLERRWSDPDYDVLWQALQDKDVVMTFHEFTRVPGTASSLVARASYKDQYPMMYLCGHTVEIQLSMMDLLLGGVCDRFPKLKIGFVEAHAAWLQGWLEMLDSVWERPLTAQARIESGNADALSPSDLFRRQCYVVAFPDDRGLDLLVERVGSQVVTLGSDYPHPQTTYGLVELFDASYDQFDEQVRRDVLGESAARFFGLPVSAS
ncbi:amidohydrolase family protein [Parasphingorhabdus sp.]|uniref:amidohydrolase family protein n=1 Tax=Parasphingorhabdus sp. TaxID=2709688 RepID=UPI003A8ECB31